MDFKFKLEKRHISAIILGAFILAVDFILFIGTAWFIPLIVIGVTMAWSQHWIDFFVKAKLDRELEEKFPEFVRNLVTAVKSGMPITRAISQIAKNDYGGLNPYVQKLAHQVEWSIPVHKALFTFSNETRNGVIKRAISTVIEAEQSGGNIEDVLEKITQSVLEIKTIKQERAASIQGQVVQSYIIFIVFLGVMIVIQNLLIPYVAGMGQTDTDVTEIIPQTGGATMANLLQEVEIDYSSFTSFITSIGEWMLSIRGVFLMLASIQGLFAGLVLGQLSTGNLKSGIKHSLILITLALFVITLAQGALTLPTPSAESFASVASALA